MNSQTQGHTFSPNGYISQNTDRSCFIGVRTDIHVNNVSNKKIQSHYDLTQNRNPNKYLYSENANVQI